jgi:hypothetical protein
MMASRSCPTWTDLCHVRELNQVELCPASYRPEQYLVNIALCIVWRSFILITNNLRKISEFVTKKAPNLFLHSDMLMRA